MSTDTHIHLCDWASQPDIRIACSQTMTQPRWGAHETSDPAVHVAESGERYTFKGWKVTCPKCKERQP